MDGTDVMTTTAKIPLATTAGRILADGREVRLSGGTKLASARESANGSILRVADRVRGYSRVLFEERDRLREERGRLPLIAILRLRIGITDSSKLGDPHRFLVIVPIRVQHGLHAAHRCLEDVYGRDVPVAGDVALEMSEKGLVLLFGAGGTDEQGPCLAERFDVLIPRCARIGGGDDAGRAGALPIGFVECHHVSVIAARREFFECGEPLGVVVRGGAGAAESPEQHGNGDRLAALAGCRGPVVPPADVLLDHVVRVAAGDACFHAVGRPLELASVEAPEPEPDAAEPAK